MGREKTKATRRIVTIIALAVITLGIFIPIALHSRTKIENASKNTNVTSTQSKKPSVKATEKGEEKENDKENGKEKTTGSKGDKNSSNSENEKDEETTTAQHLSKVVYTGGALPYCDYVDNSYFNDAIFIGDSVSLKLKYYASNGSLGSANMSYCVGNFGTVNALRGNIVSNIWDKVASSGKKRVYIMLGMNDLNVVGVDGAVSNMKTLCYKIQNAFAAKNGYNPLIYIQSMTPITQKKDGTNGKILNNANIAIYNQKLSSMAASNGWYFVDVASVMYNDKGYLKDEYCGDPNGMGLHFSTAGCAKWVSYLHTHAYDPSWAVYPLTIRYHKDGTVFKTYSQKYKAGDTFSITSPEVKGYTVDKATIKGTFAHKGQEFDVYYTPETKYTLKINYVNKDGGAALASAYSGSYKQGDKYSVKTPTVSGFTPDKTVVSGTMGKSNVTVTVYYTKNAAPPPETTTVEPATQAPLETPTEPT